MSSISLLNSLCSGIFLPISFNGSVFSHSALHILRIILSNLPSGSSCISISSWSVPRGHAFLILHDPCSLAQVSAHLKKQQPLLDYMDGLRLGRTFTRRWNTMGHAVILGLVVQDTKYGVLWVQRDMMSS